MGGESLGTSRGEGELATLGGGRGKRGGREGRGVRGAQDEKHKGGEEESERAQSHPARRSPTRRKQTQGS